MGKAAQFLEVRLAIWICKLALQVLAQSEPLCCKLSPVGKPWGTNGSPTALPPACLRSKLIALLALLGPKLSAIQQIWWT